MLAGSFMIRKKQTNYQLQVDTMYAFQLDHFQGCDRGGQLQHCPLTVDKDWWRQCAVSFRQDLLFPSKKKSEKSHTCI